MMSYYQDYLYLFNPPLVFKYCTLEYLSHRRITCLLLPHYLVSNVGELPTSALIPLVST